MKSAVSSIYSAGTRLFHAGLALAVLSQLTSSQFMQAPRQGRPGDWVFEVHEYSGLFAMVMALGLWIVVMTRIGGTDMGLLLPWFSAARREAFATDAKRHWAAVRAFQLPEYQPDAPFAATIHGFGLLLITAMAATGTIYWLGGIAGYQDGATVALAVNVHGFMANIVWAYLIGHAGMALIHHFTGQQSLRAMWSTSSSSKEHTK